MARREITQYFDDLDNSPLTEENHREIRFSIDEVDYIIDLSLDNAEKFDAALAPFLEVARQAPVDHLAKTEPAEIRKWAQEEGLAIAHRGKIPHSIVEAYLKAHVG